MSRRLKLNRINVIIWNHDLPAAQQWIIGNVNGVRDRGFPAPVSAHRCFFDKGFGRIRVCVAQKLSHGLDTPVGVIIRHGDNLTCVRGPKLRTEL